MFNDDDVVNWRNQTIIITNSTKSAGGEAICLHILLNALVTSYAEAKSFISSAKRLRPLVWYAQHWKQKDGYIFITLLKMIGVSNIILYRAWRNTLNVILLRQ